MTTSEINLNLPKSKLNDTNFLREKLLEVSLNTLQEISKHTEKNFLELVQHFIKDITEDDNNLLEKWNLSFNIVNNIDNSTIDQFKNNDTDNQVCGVTEDNSHQNSDIKSIEVNGDKETSKKKIKITVKKQK